MTPLQLFHEGEQNNCFDIKRIWEIDIYFKCPVIGACLSVQELKKILKKTGICIKHLNPYQLHRTVMENMGNENRVSRKVDVYLKHKFRKELSQFGSLDESEFEAAWKRHFEQGEISALLWIAATRSDLSEQCLEKVFGDIHMLSHENVNDADIEAVPTTGSQSSQDEEFFDEENDDEQEGIKKDVEGNSPVKPKNNDLFFESTKQRRDKILLLKRMFEDVLRGHSSTESRKFLDLLCGAKVDWKRILRDSLNRALDRSAELTWGKPKLSWLVNADRLPYLPNYTEEPRLGTVIISIDESASMPDRAVSKAIDIVCQAKDKYKKIYVIKHDVNVTWTEEYENIGPYEKKILLERRHSGGTSHKNVFKEVKRYVRSHEGDLVSAYIGITDMESDIPECQDLLAGFIPRIYLTNNRSLPEGITGKVINLY